MPLLHEIQAAIVEQGTDLGSVLLKLRLLASRLGSDILEDWVKHEGEGYPPEAGVPEYRKMGVSYRGTFSGPYGSGVKNAPIPLYLIEKHAGEHWLGVPVRESIAAVDAMVKSSADGLHLGIDCSNLILLLQGKIFEGYGCLEITGTISRTAMAEIQQAVRSRILELTIELERSIPAAAEISAGGSESAKGTAERVQQITNQVVYGNLTTVTIRLGTMREAHAGTWPLNQTAP